MVLLKNAPCTEVANCTSFLAQKIIEFNKKHYFQPHSIVLFDVQNATTKTTATNSRYTETIAMHSLNHAAKLMETLRALP